jgi:hypothetical protein
MNTRFTALRDTVVFGLVDPISVDVKKGETLDSKARSVQNYGTKIHVNNMYVLNRDDWSIVHYTDR